MRFPDYSFFTTEPSFFGFFFGLIFGFFFFFYFEILYILCLRVGALICLVRPHFLHFNPLIAEVVHVERLMIQLYH
jgi:hypothetical protein